MQTFFLVSGFLLQTLTIHRNEGKGRGPSLFFSTTWPISRTFRELFATLHVKWLPHTFKHKVCNYQTSTWWDLPRFWLTNWLIDDGILIIVDLMMLDFIIAILTQESDGSEITLAITPVLQVNQLTKCNSYPQIFSHLFGFLVCQMMR